MSPISSFFTCEKEDLDRKRISKLYIFLILLYVLDKMVLCNVSKGEVVIMKYVSIDGDDVRRNLIQTIYLSNNDLKDN
jgi:hypothetical protein